MSKSLLWGLLSLVVRDPGALSAGLVRAAKVAVLSAVAAFIGAEWTEAFQPWVLPTVLVVLAGFEKWVKEKFGVGL